MQIHLCGVRGSMPSTGELFDRVGGNTSCVALAHDGERYPSMILDAGTGLRRLSEIMDGQPFRGALVIGHLHWDHIMGLPFFGAGDRPGSRVDLMLPEQGTPAEELLARVMAPPFFPIEPSQLRGEWTFSTYEEGTMTLEGFTVTAREIPHKGGRTMGLRVCDGRTSIAYLSDHAPISLGPGIDGLGELHPAALELVDGVDLVIHDAQYTSDELPGRATWGHSAADYAVNLAHAGGARRVLLFHHDPWRTDAQVDAIRQSIEVPEGMQVDVAVERTVICL